MKKTYFLLAIFAVVLMTLGLFSNLNAKVDEQTLEELAQKIIRTSADVKPGDVVVITGGVHTIPLMEFLAIEAEKAGGMATLFLYSDRVTRSYYAKVDEKYLGQEPVFFAEWLKQMDVLIQLPWPKNPQAIFADIAEKRFKKASKASQYMQDMVEKFGMRIINVGYPNKERADIYQMDYESYEKMHWAAVSVDYQNISEKGTKLKKILQGSAKVHVSSADGVDFTFDIGNRPIFIDDGIVTKEEASSKSFFNRFASLPGGSVFVAPIESSANGKIVIPKNRCNFEPFTGVSFELKNGKMINFEAENGKECFEKSQAPYDGPKDMFATFTIGLNPELVVANDDGNYWPLNAAGMVTIRIGNNLMEGGSNRTQAYFSFPIVNATVSIDGKIVVKNGELKL